jgi:hypothetical protein
MAAPDEVTRREKCALLFLSAGLDACARAETLGLGDMQPNGHLIGDLTVESARCFPVRLQAMQREP